MITFAHTYKTYQGGIHALKDVTFSIEKGEFVYLTGPSGAGKTTLFRLISAYDRPTSGLVQIAGYDTRAMKDREIPFFRRKIGVVYQDFRLLKARTVFENVALPLEVRGERRTYTARRVRDVLGDLGLGGKVDFYPEQLSGGEQQRVAIARALIHQPGVLIADEPTGNLDPQLSLDIMDLLEKVNAQGTTVFVATHDMEMVRRRARRTIDLRHGEIVRSL